MPAKLIICVKYRKLMGDWQAYRNDKYSQNLFNLYAKGRTRRGQLFIVGSEILKVNADAL